MKTFYLSIIAILLIVSGNTIYTPTKSYAAYVGPDCNEKDVVGFSPITSKVAFLSNEGSAVLDNFTLYTVNSNGTGVLAKIGKVVFTSPITISPDGKKILFSSDINGTNQLLISNIDGTGLRQLTNGMGSVSAIAFFPNSTRIIFGQNLQFKTGFSNIYSINSDGSSLFQITHDPQEKFWSAVSGNGKVIVYNTEEPFPDGNIFAINTDGTNWHLVTSGSLFTHKKSITDNGTKIIFTRYNNGGIHYEFLYSINTDGTGFAVVGTNPYYGGDFITTVNGSTTYYWPVLRTNSSEIIFPERVNGTMQIFTSKDNGIHKTPLVDNSYFVPNPNCKIPCDMPSGCGENPSSGTTQNQQKIAYTEDHTNPDTSNAIVLAEVEIPIAAGVVIGIFLFNRKTK